MNLLHSERPPLQRADKRATGRADTASTKARDRERERVKEVKWLTLWLEKKKIITHGANGEDCAAAS